MTDIDCCLCDMNSDDPFHADWCEFVGYKEGFEHPMWLAGVEVGWMCVPVDNDPYRTYEWLDLDAVE